MITKKTGFEIDGKFFASIEEAKAFALLTLFIAHFKEKVIEEYTCDDLVNAIMANQSAVLDILTTTAKSRPSARKQNGAVRKTRKQIRKDALAQFNEAATKSADEMRERITKTGGVV